jgi:hypothetical protein
MKPDTEERAAALAAEYTRLAHAARAVVDECRPAGSDEPMCAVPPHRIRRLRRELNGTPQPSGFQTMSTT